MGLEDEERDVNWNGVLTGFRVQCNVEFDCDVLGHSGVLVLRSESSAVK